MKNLKINFKSLKRFLPCAICVVVVLLLNAPDLWASPLGRGTNFSHQDSVQTTTVEIDSVWDGKNGRAPAWKTVTIRTDSCALFYKTAFSAADTTDWFFRDWSLLDAFSALRFDSSTPLWRFTFKTSVGSCYTYFDGTRGVKQIQR
jgi:hypothetical protein